MKLPALALLIAALAVPSQAEEFITLTRTPTIESKLPTNVSTISAEDIRRSGAVNAAEALQVVPGIDVQQSGSLGNLATVRLRGVPESNSVQVVVDGQPVGGVSIQNINLALIPTGNIERIEIVRGASSMLYGANTTGGVIHIITKKTTGTPAVQLGEEVQSFRTRIFRTDAGGSFGSWDLLGSGSGYHTDGYMQNSDIDNQTVSGHMGYRFGNGGHIEAASSFTNHEGGTSDGTPTPFDQWNGHEERIANSLTQKFDNEMWRNRITLEAPLAPHASVTTSAYHQHESYLFFNRPAIPFFTDSGYVNRILGGDARVSIDEGTTIGANYERDDRDSIGQDSHDIVNAAAWVEQEIDISRLTLDPAVRYDHHSTFGGTTNPRLAAIYRMNPSWKLSASAARSFRAPTLVDLYFSSHDPFFPQFDFVGNPNLKPEKAWAYDAGTRFAPVDGFETGISGFFTRITDRITSVDTNGDGNVDTVQNGPTAEVSGVEMDAHAVTGPFRHHATYTYQRAEGTSPTDTHFVELRLTPRHTANYRLVWEAPGKLEVTNTVQYVSRQFGLDNRAGTVLPPYAVWNVRLEQPIGPVRLYAGIDNITNRLYAESITFGIPVPQPTRLYYGGVKVRLGSAQ